MPAERLRFTDFNLTRGPGGRCVSSVTLAWNDGETFVGTAEGTASQAGELRCAAQACVSALHLAVPELRPELLGVKAVRAFESVVVIVSLAVGADAATRVVGSCLTDFESPRGAVLAVLNATNRMLSDQVARR